MAWTRAWTALQSAWRACRCVLREARPSLSVTSTHPCVWRTPRSVLQQRHQSRSPAAHTVGRRTARLCCVDAACTPSRSQPRLGLSLLSAGKQGATGGSPQVQPRVGDGPDAGHGVRVPAPAHAAAPCARGRAAAARGRAAAPAGLLRRHGPRVGRGRRPARLCRPALGGRAGASPPVPQAAALCAGRAGGRRCLPAQLPFRTSALPGRGCRTSGCPSLRPVPVLSPEKLV